MSRLVRWLLRIAEMDHDLDGTLMGSDEILEEITSIVELSFILIIISSAHLQVSNTITIVTV